MPQTFTPQAAGPTYFGTGQTRADYTAVPLSQTATIKNGEILKTLGLTLQAARKQLAHLIDHVPMCIYIRTKRKTPKRDKQARYDLQHILQSQQERACAQ